MAASPCEAEVYLYFKEINFAWSNIWECRKSNRNTNYRFVLFNINVLEIKQKLIKTKIIRKRLCNNNVYLHKMVIILKNRFPVTAISNKQLCDFIAS